MISNLFRTSFTRAKTTRDPSYKFARTKHSTKKLLCSIHSSMVNIITLAFVCSKTDHGLVLLRTFFQYPFNLHPFSDGEAYCLGSVNTDCWYLYTLNREKCPQTKKDPDQTLEILMTNLDKEVMAIFTRDVCSSAAEATAKSGIEKLIPNMIIDDFLFEPCGYSMNGVSKSVS